MAPTVIEDQAGLDALFAGIADDFGDIDWRLWLTQCMNELEQEHSTMWGEQRSPGGDKWAPLAPSTVKRKGHPTILYETGALRESLTQPNAGIREIFQENGNIGLIFGTDVPYSIFHLRGTSRMPARDHVGLPLTRFEMFVESACDHALAELKQ